MTRMILISPIYYISKLGIELNRPVIVFFIAFEDGIWIKRFLWKASNDETFSWDFINFGILCYENSS